MSEETAPVADVVGGSINKGGRPVRAVEEWGKAFLAGVRKSGNISRSARKARVAPGTVRKYARAHPEFSRRIAAALREYGDRLEENLGELAFKGNVIANISRLKGLNERLARKYSEKAIDARILNLTVNQYAAPADLPAWSDDDIMDSTRAQLLRVPDAALPPDLLRLKQRALEAPIEDAEIVTPPPAEGQDTP